MYYGMISPTVGVCSVRVNENLNALGYEEILFDHLVPFFGGAWTILVYLSLRKE